MNITVKIQGLSKLQNNLRRYPQISAPIIQKAVDSSGALVHRSVKENVRGSGHSYKKRPFASGHMFEMIKLQPRPLGVVIWPDVNYAIYPHEGLSTSKKYGRRPFMEDAVQDNQSKINKIFIEALDKITERLAS
jgi:hypothetical protein